MGKIVGRVQDGNLLLAGQVDERRPMVTSGLIVNYPLDGSLNSYRFSPAGLKVLYQAANNTVNGYNFCTWLANNGAIMTQSTDLTTVTVATAQTYDLIVADFYAWGVSSAIVSALKTFVDAGVSCVATGNDTQTTLFVSSYNSTSTLHNAHDVLIADSYPTYTSLSIYKGGGSSDVIGGISALQNGARPLYYRSDSTNLIMGYWYESNSGAILYFDQEGLGTPEFVQNMILFAAQRTNAQITSSNLTWTEDGVSISRASSNLIKTTMGADAFFDTAGGWNLVNDTNYTSAVQYTPGAIYGLGNALRVTDNDGNTATSEWGGVTMSTITGLTNQTYTMSIRYKVVGWTTGTVAIWSHQQDSTAVNPEKSDDYGLPSGTFDGQWHVYSVTKTQTSGYDKRTISIGMDKTNLGCTIYVDAIQFESGGFLTSFENGSGGDTKLQIGHGGSSTWTVHFDYYHTDLSSFGSNMVMASSYNGSNAGTWFGLNASTNTIDNFGSPASPTNQWNSAIFTYDGTTTTFYLNGVQKGTSTGSYFFNGADFISFSSMVGWNVNTFIASWKIRNYSLYNRVLTAAEIQKTAKPSFSVKKDGTIAISNIREMPNNITGSAYYFPLTMNGNDTTGQITPSTDSNTVYTKDGLYLDKGTTNLVANPTGVNGAIPSTGNAWDINLHRDALSVSNWSSGYNSGVTDPQIGYHAKWVDEGLDGGPCIKFMDLNSQFTYTAGGAMTHRWLGVSSGTLGVGTSLGWAVGTSITISWLQKTDTTGKGATIGILHKSIATGGTVWGSSEQAVTSKRVGVWERVSFTFTIDSDWDLTQNYNYIYIYGYNGPEGILWVDDIQVETGTYPTGFTIGTRGVSLLKYPLTFTPNMSFSFWHKLNNDLASITTQGASPNLFEVGDYYANSSFTLWYWGGSSGLRAYGRQDGATGWTISGATLSGTFDQTYWNKWHNYTFVFNGSGTTITGVTVYIDGTARYTNSSLTITSWSGSFFGFGSYNGMQPNAIYRDMIYTPTALSSTDALNLYKNQMRAYKDNRIQTRTKLIEGQVM